MTAKLLSFTQSRHGWGNVELAQFVRIQRLLENVGLQIDLEHGVSDEGEPWCVFCSSATGDVMIHAASINGRYMFDSPVLRGPIEGRSFQNCAEKFIEEALEAIPVVRRRATFQIHPSALLASVFLTILLQMQATSEQSLFRPASDHADHLLDLDAADPAAAQATTWIRQIAQQIAEFFTHPSEPSQAANQNHLLQSWAQAAIPVGLTASILGIVHELITRDDKLLLALDGLPVETAAAEETDATLSDVAERPDETAAPVVGTTETAAAPTDAGPVADEATAEALPPQEPEVPGEAAPPSPIVAVAAATPVSAPSEQDADGDRAETTAAMMLAGDWSGVATPDADGAEAVASSATSAAGTMTLAALAMVSFADDDTIEFISFDRDAGVVQDRARNEEGSSPSVGAGVGAVVGIAYAYESSTPAPAAADPEVDFAARLAKLIEIGRNVSFFESDGDIVIVDRDAAKIVDPDERYVAQFSLDDDSQIMFIGVAADFDGLLI